MTLKPGIQLLLDLEEHVIPGRRIPGMTGAASDDNILGKVTPDTGNLLPIPRPDVDDATPDGLTGDIGNGKSCVLHDNQASLYDIEKRANVFALKARRAGTNPESELVAMFITISFLPRLIIQL